MNSFLRAMAVGVCVLALSHAAAGQNVAPTAQGASQVSAAEAGPFLGDWTLALQGPNGPGSCQVSVRVEKEKVAAEISSDELAKQPISTISLAGTNLTLSYT